MMMNIGVGVALGSWLSFAILTIGTIATYLYRVRVEEQALLNTIGEPYRSYMQETKRFVPHIV
jgi:protein-S-isoprenylcysteine O-methyltransferase Ste14